MFYSPHVRTTPSRSDNLTLIYAYLTSQLFFSISTGNKESLKKLKYTGSYCTAFNLKSQVFILTGQFDFSW